MGLIVLPIDLLYVILNLVIEMKEIWKTIPEYEERYMVSNLGRVKSLSRKKWNRFEFFTTKEIILGKRYNKKGYLSVILYKNDTKKCFAVHRLVAQAFIPNPENKAQINHINCIKDNNTVENLEWCTNQENQTHAKMNHLYKSKVGTLNPNSKSVIQLDLNGNFIKKWDCMNDVKRFYKLNGAHISDVCKEKRKMACGFKWKYYNESESD